MATKLQMMEATRDVLSAMDEAADARRAEIRGRADACVFAATVYYVSATGCDEQDGRTPETAWRSVARVNRAILQAGDAVLFRRGDVFRGETVVARAGVTYAAYGEGNKPELRGWSCNLADSTLWEPVGATGTLWRLRQPILDVGTLVMNEGETWSRKLIPSYIGGRFVCREDESRPFEMACEMTQDLDLYWHFDAVLTDRPSRGECFPVPQVDDTTYGTLYLRCDRGNPGDVFASVEALPKRCGFRVSNNADVHIDNLCLRYFGHHAISAGGRVKGLHVSGCEIGWIGGTIQHYMGTDPNYPEGGRGTVTRFGNAVEIYGGCTAYTVEDCYIYQCYDAGITHQITTNGKTYTQQGIRYCNNLVERCVYSIEYFLDMTGGDEQSLMEDVRMEGNLLRLAGYGWGQQRHNVHTPAHIKGWSYINRAKDFLIKNNVFDRCAYRLVHLVALRQESCPVMEGNTYLQYRGGMLGQYGANAVAEPPVLLWDDDAADSVATVLCDRDAVLYWVKENL